METQIVGEKLKITADIYFDLGNGQEQKVPLGVFNCDEPTVFASTTAYECYDNMLLFDKNVETRSAGLPYWMASYICTTCGVVLGNTQAEFSYFVNHNQQVVIDPVEISTYRDALSMLASILGCYCIIGVDGKLYFRTFHITPDMVIAKGRRISCGFGGYKTCIAGVRCRFLAEQNYYPYEYISENPGLIIDLGDLPIIEDTVSAKEAILKNLYDDVLAYIEYYPCELAIPGDPSIEPGDMLTTKDRSGVDKNILLTSVTYTWRGESALVSEGGNPKLNAVATSEKRTQKQIENQGQTSQLITATYVNASEITVDGTDEENLTLLRFVTNKDLTAIFGCEIPYYSDGEGYVDLTYTDAGIDGDTVRKRVHAGYDSITLVNHLYYQANKIVHLMIKAITSGISGGLAPTLTIAQNTIRSYVFAQGIEAEAPWDGIITIAEEVGYVAAYMQFAEITGAVTVTVYNPVREALAENIVAIVATMQAGGISDTITVELHYGDHICFCGEGYYAGTDGVLL